MKVAMIGTGYVGLVTGTCLSELGNEVICVDIDEEKIDKLKGGKIPIYEPGLEAMVKENVERDHLHFTSDLGMALKASNICFIAVGTPMGDDGSADLHFVLDVAKEIGEKMDHHMYIVDKSTVPVGSSEKVRKTIQKELDRRKINITFVVISNPEFLKEGNAIQDAMRPDRIVIGTDSKDAESVMRELYKGFVINTNNIITMDLASAEMTKYAANSMLATKISYMNEIANICELVGADVNKVRLGIGSDHRIGYSFIYAGCGYGGSCFPKDVRALIKTSESFGYEPALLKAVENVNTRQKMVLINKVIKKFGDNLDGKTFGIWGLAFKPETDDMRESTAITVIKELVKRGAKIRAYDPKAIEEAKTCYLKDIDIEYTKSKYSALNGIDALLLITEWAEFRNPDFFEMGQRMKERIIFDGRNQYDKSLMEKYGFEYYQIGSKQN